MSSGLLWYVRHQITLGHIWRALWLINKEHTWVRIACIDMAKWLVHRFPNVVYSDLYQLLEIGIIHSLVFITELLYVFILVYDSYLQSGLPHQAAFISCWHASVFGFRTSHWHEIIRGTYIKLVQCAGLLMYQWNSHSDLKYLSFMHFPRSCTQLRFVICWWSALVLVHIFCPDECVCDQFWLVFSSQMWSLIPLQPTTLCRAIVAPFMLYKYDFFGMLY